LGHEGPFFHVGPRRSRGRYGKKRTQVPQKSAKVDILPISIYLVVVLYRHKHCRPQKVELDLACRDSTTTKVYSKAHKKLANSSTLQPRPDLFLPTAANARARPEIIDQNHIY
jgi:hypothetical protein